MNLYFLLLLLSYAKTDNENFVDPSTLHITVHPHIAVQFTLQYTICYSKSSIAVPKHNSTTHYVKHTSQYTTEYVKLHLSAQHILNLLHYSTRHSTLYITVHNIAVHHTFLLHFVGLAHCKYNMHTVSMDAFTLC
jgi:hypothetical protein